MHLTRLFEERIVKTTNILIMICALSLVAESHAVDAVPSCGSVTMTLFEGKAASIGWVDAYFSDSASRSEVLSGPAPGNAPFVRLSGIPGTLGTSTTSGVPGTPGVVRVNDPIRTFGSIPMPALPETYPGVPGVSRSRQVTTLKVDPNNILGAWTPSSDDSGIFVGNSTLGEQIAFTSMQRWGGPFTGVLVYGDFALRYAPGRVGQIASDGVLSGLVLTSNIDFLNVSFADLANATITSDGHTLTISGDLLISGALFVLDSSAVVGTKFGTFSLTTCLTPSCIADFNGVGGVTVQDLFDFLSAWFSHLPSADVNGDGSVTVQDLFDFLSHWFAHC